MTTAHADAHTTHPPHLAHHFDTPQQQFESGKLGMWVFLATEILMFGGLFCAYSVYRANHPEVFIYAHHYLDTFWGATNTVVLLVSSFTMAWGVRAAALGQKNLLVAMLFLTLLGGLGFLCIKAVEYDAKFSHDLAPGRFNLFAPVGPDVADRFQHIEHLEHEYGMRAHAAGDHAATGEAHGDTGHHEGDSVSDAVQDMAADGAPGRQLAEGMSAAPSELPVEVSLIAPAAEAPEGLSPHARLDSKSITAVVPHGIYDFDALNPKEKQRVGIFFSIYWLMTGLHGLHVLIGLGIIAWLMYRAGSTRDRAWTLPTPLVLAGLYFIFLWWLVDPGLASIRGIPVNQILGVLGVLALVLGAAWIGLRFAKARTAPQTDGDFGPQYFAPVDIGGLYWHLVDLIWIFLFPLLYLIH